MKCGDKKCAAHEHRPQARPGWSFVFWLCKIESKSVHSQGGSHQAAWWAPSPASWAVGWASTLSLSVASPLSPLSPSLQPPDTTSFTSLSQHRPPPPASPSILGSCGRHQGNVEIWQPGLQFYTLLGELAGKKQKL